MIRFLRGKIIETLPNLVIEVSGVGYEVFSVEDLSRGRQAELWIYHHIREDRQELYGFIQKEQLRLFEMLLGVSGVGPKAAMAILRNLETSKIEQAIIQGEVDILSAVPGIGKKAATKIIVELKTKLDKLGEVNIKGLGQSSEVVEALRSLGYSQSEIYAIIKKIPSRLKDTQGKITWAIRHIGEK
jgi:Holliday junction DNA helicase RuvA